MRKYFKWFLAALTCAALTFSFAGCGEEEDNNISNNNSSEQESIPENIPENIPEGTPESGGTTVSFQVPEILKSLPAVGVESLANTGWQLVGGLSNNSELTDEQYAQVLENFGGFYIIVFNDGGKADITAGENYTTADYELVNENAAVTIQNENAYMAGVFILTDEEVTMIIVNQNDPETALYFRQIDER